MISRIIAAITILVVIYVWLIFLAPELADTYGIQSVNEKVRMMKRAAELDRTDMLTGSLVDKAADIAKPYIDESKKMMDDTKKTIESVNTVVNEKTEQAKQAAQTAQEAYDKAQEVKNKLDTLTNFWTGK